VFLVGVTFGQLGGAVVYDHAGAFGNAVHSANVLRMLGPGVVLAGAVMVRFAD